MTAAQLIHFAIVISLGILAFLTFLVAGTILGLMIVEDIGCDYCVTTPVGLFVLGFLGLLLLISAVRELIEGPYLTWDWLTKRQEGLTLALLVLLVLLIVL